MVKILFCYLAVGLLLVTVAGVAQPKQPGVVGPLLLRQRRQKIKLRLMMLVVGVPGLE